MRLPQTRVFAPEVLCLGLVALLGCAGGNGNNDGPPQSNILRTEIPADPAMIDPITYSELYAGDVIDDMYESFVALDPEGNVTPALATRWEAHDDNRGFRFVLRENVLFHSGRKLTAHDVKFTLEQLLIPGNRGGLNAKYAARIEGAASVQNGETTELSGFSIMSEQEFEVRFSEPEVLFPIFPIYIMDRGVVAEHGESWWREVSAGTGPFRFVEWERGQRVRLEAHQGYWRGAPSVAGVDYFIVPSDDTAISMYEAGELDLVFIDAVASRRVLQESRFEDERLLTPAAQINYLGMNQNLYEPFRDIRVREAICRAIDFAAMSEGLFHGAAKPLAGQITEGVAGYNAELEPPAFDPERARTLLSEAGFAGGAGLPPLKISGTEPNRRDLAYFANQLETVAGFPVTVEIVERGVHLKAMNAGQVAFFPWGWSAAYPDGMYFLQDVWHGASVYNRSRWQNDSFDEIIDTALQTPDNSARYELYHQAEKILLDDWGTCPTTVRMQIALKKPYLNGVSLTAFRFLPFWQASFSNPH